ncbi:MAG: CAP domain-containing protein [Chloroflexota bacterium]
MRKTIRTTSLALLVIAAVAAVTLTAWRNAEAQTVPGVFVSTPIFDARGTGFAVFSGGSLVQLEAAAQASGATGVWAQDAMGAYQLLVVGGPAFLKAPFTAAFPSGFAGATALTLVRPAGATSAPPAATATPAPTATPAATPVATATPAPVALTFEQQVTAAAFTKTNEQRVANGLSNLVRNSKLDTSAAAYAKVVFDLDPYLSNVANAHTMDGQPCDRATRVGYVWATFAENVYMAASTTSPTATALAQTTVDGWMNSPPHRANILTPGFIDTGVGCVTGRPASPRPGLEFVAVCVGVYGTSR